MDTPNQEALPDARLSEQFRDPFLRRAFRRAERDGGLGLAAPADPHKPKLTDGAVERPHRILEAAHG